MSAFPVQFRRRSRTGPIRPILIRRIRQHRTSLIHLTRRTRQASPTGPMAAAAEEGQTRD
jgi:hypothetical protein